MSYSISFVLYFVDINECKHYSMSVSQSCLCSFLCITLQMHVLCLHIQNACTYVSLQKYIMNYSDSGYLECAWNYMRYSDIDIS